jgi:hypothetical protein
MMIRRGRGKFKRGSDWAEMLAAVPDVRDDLAVLTLGEVYANYRHKTTLKWAVVISAT